MKDLRRAVAVKRRVPHQTFVPDHAYAPYIGVRSDEPSLIASLLRRHVLGRAHDHAVRGAEASRMDVLKDLRDPEVQQLRRRCAVRIERQHDVLGFKVPMHDPELMGPLEGIDQREQNGERVFFAKMPVLEEHVAKRRPVQELHHQIRDVPTIFTHVEDVDDVWVVELNRRTRFSQEPFAQSLEMGECGVQYLHSHLSLRPDVRRAVHRGHAARPYDGAEPVLAAEQGGLLTEMVGVGHSGST